MHKKLIAACLKKGNRRKLRELTRYREGLAEECSREDVLPLLDKILQPKLDDITAISA